MLTSNELERYNRHIKLQEVGTKGQIKLKNAKVLVIGAGGLGCPVLLYLASAGVGNIGIVDDDKVSLSNLQRQILYTVDDIGKSKANTALRKLKNINPLLQIESKTERLTPQNALDIIKPYNIIVDATDNFSTRYLINDACVILNKPLVYGAIHRFEGQVSVFNYKGSGTYRCLFPTPPTQEQMPNCSETGVIGVLPGIIGTMQANEVIKLILGIGTPSTNKLQLYSAFDNSITSIRFYRNEKEVQRLKENGIQNDYNLNCNINTIKEISTKEAENLLYDDNTVFLDVREFWEQPRIPELNAIEIPLDDLEDDWEQLPKDKTIIVFCQSGGRSKQAIDYLNSNYGYTNLINLKNGILEWDKH